MLDEPTNDLDVETLELLGSLIVGYQGTVLLVSHDRAFLNDVATGTLAIEPGGRVKEYDGGYDDYLRQRQSEARAEADRAPAASSKPAAAPTVAERPRKLSYKERRELDELPSRIETLEASRVAIHDAMGDPAFYRQSAGEIGAAKAKLDAVERDLAEAYARWEALEEIAG